MQYNPALAEGNHYFSSDGIQIKYRVAGRGASIFVAHAVGWGSPGSYLRNGFGRDLETEYTMIYVIPRGNGNSGRPVDETAMSCRIMADDIEQLRLHLGLERIPILFGHSSGAAIVLRYAERYQQRVAKLVLVGAQTHDSPPNDEFAEWVAKRKDDPIFGPALAAMINARNNYPPATDEEFIKVLEQSRPYYFSDNTGASKYPEHVDLDDTPARVWAMVHNAASDRKPENRLPHVADASQVTAKTLILWGQDDPLCSLTAARALAEGIKDAELVPFDSCGHIPWVEKKEDFMDVLRGFLGK
jgi:pimeloyl-ACP methyl ester carboxylesterase